MFAQSSDEVVTTVVGILVFGFLAFLILTYHLGRNAIERDRRKKGLFLPPLLTPGKRPSAPADIGQQKPAPPWFLPAGIIAVILGILGFFLGGAVGGGGSAFGSALAGLLNPFFFIGLPLGIYWLVRYAKQQAIGVNPSARPPGRSAHEDNPRLTHCPDCGGHVSRLAAACPHCGRPMKDEA